ncbi:MAG: DMT family transporter [Myxococcaceae bacterium]
MKGAPFVVLAAFLWGLWPLFLKQSTLPGYASGFVAMAVVSLAAIPVVFMRRGKKASRKALLALIGVGATDAANVALYFGAVDRGPVAVATLTHYLAPLLVCFGAPVFLGEAWSKRAIIATPVVLGALWLVVSGGASAKELPWITAALGAGSAVFYAANVLCSKAAAESYQPFEVVALHGPVAAACLLVVFRGQALPTHFDLGLVSVLAGSLVAGLGATVAFNFGLRGVSAPVAGVITYLEPLVAAASGVLFFNEALGPLRIAGAAVVVGCGVWVALEKPLPPKGTVAG